MIIQLSSLEAFDRVREKLEKEKLWNEEFKEWFFKYIAPLKEYIVNGGNADEYYIAINGKTGSVTLTGEYQPLNPRRNERQD